MVGNKFHLFLFLQSIQFLSYPSEKNNYLFQKPYKKITKIFTQHIYSHLRIFTYNVIQFKYQIDNHFHLKSIELISKNTV